jgi:small subunit ribosomal protein S8
MTDPIADYLTRIRNALLAKHASVDIPFSSLKVEVTKILEKEGYIEGYRVVEGSPRGSIKIALRYGSTATA